MIEIFKAENPKILQYMYPTFNDFPRDNECILKELLTRWAASPEETCLIVAFDDRILKGYVFAYVHPDQPDAWIEVCWGDPNFPVEYKKEIEAKLDDWVLSKGKTEIKMQTTRLQVKAWTRLYGYKEHAIIMRKDLSNGRA